MSGKYASQTAVSIDRSRVDIERCLERYGARGFYYGSEADRAMIGFRVLGEHGRMVAVRMHLGLPDPDADEFTKTPTGKDRTGQAARQAWEQSCRSRWRALLLIVKAKLEAVSVGITTIEREFMPDVLLGDGRTIGEVVEEQRAALEGGERLLLLPRGRS